MSRVEIKNLTQKIGACEARLRSMELNIDAGTQGNIKDVAENGSRVIDELRGLDARYKNLEESLVNLHGDLMDFKTKNKTADRLVEIESMVDKSLDAKLKKAETRLKDSNKTVLGEQKSALRKEIVAEVSSKIKSELETLRKSILDVGKRVDKFEESL